MRISLLLLLLCFTFSNFAQNTGLEAIDFYGYLNTDYVKTTRRAYSYSATNKIESETYFSYNSNTQGWDVSTKNAFAYDPNDNLSHIYWLSLNAGGQFDTIGYVVYTYNSLGDRLTEIWNNRNMVDLTYFPSKKFEWTYSNGQLTDVNEFTYDNGQWEDRNHDQYTYYPNGDVHTMVRSAYSSFQGAWRYEFTYSYIYSFTGQLEELQVEKWHTQDSVWYDDNYQRYEYDSNDNLIAVKTRTKNYNDVNWKNYDSTSYVRNSQGILESILGSSADISGQSWSFTNRDRIRIDSTHSYANIFVPERAITYYNDWDKGSEKIDTIYLDYWNFQNQSYRMVGKRVYHYSTAIVSSVSDVQTAQLLVYPNPATDRLFFDGVQVGFNFVQIFDVKGALVKEVNLGYDSSVDISSLKDGMYFYTLNSNGSFDSGSFVKK